MQNKKPISLSPTPSEDERYETMAWVESYQAKGQAMSDAKTAGELANQLERMQKNPSVESLGNWLYDYLPTILAALRRAASPVARAEREDARRYVCIKRDPIGSQHLLRLLQLGKGNSEDFDAMVDRIDVSQRALKDNPTVHSLHELNRAWCAARDAARGEGER